MTTTAKQRTEIRRVTPDMARSLLERNHGNRRIRRAHVEYFKGVIARGQWQLTSTGISLAPDGSLLNGQHRLTAVAEGTDAVDMVFLLNAAPASFMAEDRVAARTLADQTRLPEGLASEISFILHRLTNTKIKPSPQDVIDASVWWQPTHDLLDRYFNRTRRSRTHSGIRVGWGFRWAITENANQRLLVERQLDAYTRGEPKDMSRATAKLWAHFNRSTGTKERDARDVDAARAFHFTNPAVRDVEPVLRSPAETLADLSWYARNMQDAFCRASKADTHVYRWNGKPDTVRAVFGAAAQHAKKRAGENEHDNPGRVV